MFLVFPVPIQTLAPSLHVQQFVVALFDAWHAFEARADLSTGGIKGKILLCKSLQKFELGDHKVWKHLGLHLNSGLDFTDAG